MKKKKERKWRERKEKKTNKFKDGVRGPWFESQREPPPFWPLPFWGEGELSG